MTNWRPSPLLVLRHQVKDFVHVLLRRPVGDHILPERLVFCVLRLLLRQQSGVLLRKLGTGHCLIFFPIFRRCKANTISGERSKKPSPFFQLMPHLQCCKPINCCFIFLPQFGCPVIRHRGD